MMMWRFLLAVLAALALAGVAEAQTFPPLSGRVVDAAGVLNPAQVAQLTALSDQVEQASTRQLVVATIPDLQGYEIEDYGYRLGRFWKIGQSGANNGIILIVAPKERRVRIEVGYGLEPIMTDALSFQIISDQILPRFKAGDLPGGILAGAGAIAEQMKLPLEAAEARAASSVAAKPQHRAGNGNLFVAFWVALIFFFVLRNLFLRGGGRRYRSSGIGGGVGDVLLWTAINSVANRNSGWGGGSDWGGGGDGGGFSGGGGSFGGGGASGGW